MTSEGRTPSPHHEFWQDPNDDENPSCRVCDKGYENVCHHQITEHDGQWSRKHTVLKAVCGGYVQSTVDGRACAHGVTSVPIYMRWIYAH